MEGVGYFILWILFLAGAGEFPDGGCSFVIIFLIGVGAGIYNLAC